MANTTASLDYERAVRLIQSMQNHIHNIRQHTSVWVGAFETAKEKSSRQVWMDETISIGTNIIKKSDEATALLDDPVLTGLRQFRDQLQEFSDSRTGLDV